MNTTTGILQARQELIKLCDLPQLYQDAVLLTRRLEVRYLWIDALCIVQDSPERWAQESAKMSSIYTNSLLAIASQSTLDVHDGFSKERCANKP